MKKLFALFLCLCLMAGIVPVMADNAAETEAAPQITMNTFPVYFKAVENVWRDDFPVYFLNGVEDMMYISSSAFSNGSAEISVYFKQGTDADKATVNVQNRVSQAEGILPAAVTQQGVTVQKSVNSILQIQSLESTDDRFDQKFIINYLDINVIPRISRITGVGSINLLGDTYGVRI